MAVRVRWWLWLSRRMVVCLWPEITTCGFLCQHICFGLLLLPLLLLLLVALSASQRIDQFISYRNYRSLSLFYTLHSSYFIANITLLALIRFANSKSVGLEERAREKSVNHQQGLFRFACCLYLNFFFISGSSFVLYRSLLVLINIALVVFAF